jgi:hypothetical protein
MVGLALSLKYPIYPYFSWHDYTGITHGFMGRIMRWKHLVSLNLAVHVQWKSRNQFLHFY